MSKIIPFPARPGRDHAPAPDPAPVEGAKVITRNPLTKAERTRQLQALARTYFAGELARSQGRLDRLRAEGGTDRRRIQAAEDEVRYYRAELANVTPADERKEAAEG